MFLFFKLFKKLGCIPTIAIVALLIVIIIHPSTAGDLISFAKNPTVLSATSSNGSYQFPNSDGSQPTKTSCNIIATAKQLVEGKKVTYWDCGLHQPHQIRWGSIIIKQKNNTWTIGVYTVKITCQNEANCQIDLKPTN